MAKYWETVKKIFFCDPAALEAYGALLYLFSGLWVITYQPIPALNPVMFPMLSVVSDNWFGVVLILSGVFRLVSLAFCGIRSRRASSMLCFLISLSYTLIFYSADVHGVAIPAFCVHAASCAWAYIRLGSFK